MAKLLDPQKLPSQRQPPPGMKAPVRQFEPTDDSNPAEVDAFNRMIREIRNNNPAPDPAENEPSPS
jgi:hypothetical protein